MRVGGHAARFHEGLEQGGAVLGGYGRVQALPYQAFEVSSPTEISWLRASRARATRGS